MGVNNGNNGANLSYYFSDKERKKLLVEWKVNLRIQIIFFLVFALVVWFGLIQQLQHGPINIHGKPPQLLGYHSDCL